MKIFTNRSVLQKIVIVLLTVILLTFSIPKPVQADWGGVLIDPIVNLGTALLDSVQYLLEWMMTGNANYFMDKTPNQVSNSQNTPQKRITDKIDDILFGKTNVPDIKYTPEAIFANRVPALDINFINPSVTDENGQINEETNVAKKLQEVIASWYVALRTLATVGLLSVLIYLGIRILLTSVAADKAKYKKILMDWVVAICLLFALHYIMAFTLTITETISSLIKPEVGETLTVEFTNIKDASGTKVFDFDLMNYVRFMIQCTDFSKKLVFFFLYLMLVIYSVRFTWTYLKRVVNMAFLTLIAPIVALTYPIDKVSDGKAQAFDMWIKEYVFNALIQPVHLLLYLVLLGSAIDLAIDNPLYAIVCLGFIFAAEKLLKQMFGFGKASGGTIGSLAGAAGVTALANKALMSIGRGPHGGKGGSQKPRMNDQYKREGKNPGANKPYDAFNRSDVRGIDALDTPKDTSLPEEKDTSKSEEGKDKEGKDVEEKRKREHSLDEPKEERPKLDGPTSEDLSPDTSGSPDPIMTEEAVEKLRMKKQPETMGSLFATDMDNLYNRIENKKDNIRKKAKGVKTYFTDKETKKSVNAEARRKAGVGFYKNIRGIAKATPTAIYKGVRGTAKMVARGAVGLAIGATAGVIGATTGDGEKALSMAAAGFGVGAATGDDVFEATVGKVARDKSVRDAYGTGKYGSAIDARNEKADKAYLKSDEHADEYEKYFKQGRFKMSKKDFDRATKQYREAGITDKKTIRNALRLEQHYRNTRTDSEEDIREEVQNIVQTYDNVDKRAVYGDEKAQAAALRNIENQLTNISDDKQRREVATKILQGYIDWYNM